MSKIRFTEQAAITAGFLLLSAALAAPQAQNSALASTSASTQGNSTLPVLIQDSSRPTNATPPPQHVPLSAMRAAPQRKPPSIDDLLAGLTLTDDEKAKVDQIKKDMRARMELVARDEKETADQKGAMIQGLQRMQRSQVYMVLTPEHQSEYRKRILAQHAAEQDANKMQHGSQPR